MVRIVPNSIDTSESFTNSNLVLNNLNIDSVSSIESFGTSLLDTSSTLKPNFISAQILNNLVVAYNKTVEQIDYAEKLRSFCVGGTANTNPRLNYGLSAISSNDFSQISKKLNIGQGILQTGDSDEKLISYFPNITTSQIGYTLNQIFSSTDDIKNCFVPGAIYLNYNNSSYSVSFVIGKSSSDLNGQNLIYHKDVELSVIEDIIFNSSQISFPKPYDNSVLLYKFILDIDKYYNDIKLDRYFIYLYDLRFPEGFYGLNDENLYFKIANYINSGKQGIINVKNTELNNIKSIIQSWVDLESWYPDFESYWAVNERTLPTELNQFLIDEMDIVI